MAFMNEILLDVSFYNKCSYNGELKPFFPSYFISVMSIFVYFTPVL